MIAAIPTMPLTKFKKKKNLTQGLLETHLKLKIWMTLKAQICQRSSKLKIIERILSEGQAVCAPVPQVVQNAISSIREIGADSCAK